MAVWLRLASTVADTPSDWDGLHKSASGELESATGTGILAEPHHDTRLDVFDEDLTARV